MSVILAAQMPVLGWDKDLPSVDKDLPSVAPRDSAQNPESQGSDLSQPRVKIKSLALTHLFSSRWMLLAETIAVAMGRWTDKKNI